jgi:hypothetical protein
MPPPRGSPRPRPATFHAQNVNSEPSARSLSALGPSLRRIFARVLEHTRPRSVATTVVRSARTCNVDPADGRMVGLSWTGLSTSRGPGRPRRRRGREGTGSRRSAGAMALPRPSLLRPSASRPGAYRRSSAAGSPLSTPRPLHRGTRRPARPGRQLWRPHLHRGHHRSSLTAHRAPKACHSPAETAGQTLSQGSPPAVRT